MQSRGRKRDMHRSAQEFVPPDLNHVLAEEDETRKCIWTAASSCDAEWDSADGSCVAMFGPTKIDLPGPITCGEYDKNRCIGVSVVRWLSVGSMHMVDLLVVMFVPWMLPFLAMPSLCATHTSGHPYHSKGNSACPQEAAPRSMIFSRHAGPTLPECCRAWFILQPELISSTLCTVLVRAQSVLAGRAEWGGTSDPWGWVCHSSTH